MGEGLAGPVPRIALGGFFLESTRAARVSGADAFRQGLDLAGDALLTELVSDGARLPVEMLGFSTQMDRLGPWEPVPLRLAVAPSGGPVDHSFFDALCANIEARLALAGPVDAVLLTVHGGALSTRDEDPEGALLLRMRSRLGPAVPLVVVADLHAHVSDRMARALSGLVACRTFPSVDRFERGQEAARMVRQMIEQGPGEVERVQLPLLTSVAVQAIAPGTPLSDLVAQGQQALDDDILNVSLCPGFALADAPGCGFGVVVTARAGAREAARQTAHALAARVWASRARFEQPLTPLAEAVAAALAAGRGQRRPLALADVGDNPGEGGSGNTTGLLRALVEAGVERAVLGVFADASLARQAHAQGVGARFEAHFNRDRTSPLAEPWRHPAQVLALSNGHFTGRQGLAQGTQRTMGPSALLQVGGVQVAVVSIRQQLLDPAQLEVLGVDLAAVRVLAAKSREHFRAGFQGFAAPQDSLAVDSPGLTTPNLRSLAWTGLTRPIYPLDPEATWPASPAPAFSGGVSEGTGGAPTIG